MGLKSMKVVQCSSRKTTPAGILPAGISQNAHPLPVHVPIAAGCGEALGMNPPYRTTGLPDQALAPVPCRRARTTEATPKQAVHERTMAAPEATSKK
jgi:hypothetical protein